MHSDLLFSLVLCGKRTKVRRKIMKRKMTGAAALAGAFVAGMVVATALGGGMAGAGAAAQGQKFWPIYNHYVKDLQEVNNQKYALLKQYAEMWATMTDQDALIYVRNWLEADGQAQALRLKYVPVVSQVLPGRKAATFFQLDRRLNMMIDLQLFSQIPLAHVKE
jgi:hypothetical protein